MQEVRTNLMRHLGAEGISTKQVQEVIGVKSDKTAYNKIYRLTEFTLPEALAIKNKWFPSIPIEELFDGYGMKR